MANEERKTCNRCGVAKGLSEFAAAKGRNGTLYHRNECKACRKLYHQQWVAANHEKHASTRKAYYEENREEIIRKVVDWQARNREHKQQYQAGWYADNRTRLLEKQAHWYRENPDKVAAYRASHAAEIQTRMREWRTANQADIRRYMERWRSENAEHLADYSRTYRKEHPEVKRLAESKRRAQKRQAPREAVSMRRIVTMYAEQEGRCVYCEKELTHEFHIDHRTPLARGGHHIAANLQLLCPRCNKRKHAKTHDEFMAVLAAEDG
ncbi:MAG: HNH endonuclease [Gammaproteobacteria bacterium]|nr:HNH endonuclease [Gammaproteobacteria bacterium]